MAPSLLITSLIQYKGNNFKLVKITLASYVTGGWPISVSDCKLRQLKNLLVAEAEGYPLYWDQAAGKLLAYSSVGVQMSNNDTSLLGSIIYALAIGH